MMSRFVPSCVPYVTPPCRGQLVAIAAGLGQLFHMVHQCIHIYGISGKMSHLSRPIPSCMGPLVAIGAGLGQLVHMVHQCIHAYIWHLRQDVPLVPSRPILSYLSNCLRYRLDLGLIGKVFESTFQILKNRISMATPIATRCKIP